MLNGSFRSGLARGQLAIKASRHERTLNRLCDVDATGRIFAICMVLFIADTACQGITCILTKNIFRMERTTPMKSIVMKSIYAGLGLLATGKGNR